ncbi:MAG: T9SS type A sorting domain-containing protein [Bacteroidia bacterium]
MDRLRQLLFVLTILSGSLSAQDSSFYSLRCLGVNVGNVAFNCWESKLCEQTVATNFRNYVQSWNPDIIMISEVYKKAQLEGTEYFGPLLPPGYACDCGKSINRYDSLPAAWDTADASHEHECIAWKAQLFTLVPNSSKSVYGRNDAYGQQNCNFDFTGHSVRLVYKGMDTITAVAIHPNSLNAQCRTYEINKYWTELCAFNKTVVAGDWNTDVDAELQVPVSFKTIFSKGHYWNLFYSASDYSQSTFIGSRHLDHAYANFGEPCTSCGGHYGTGNLVNGAALGGYQSHPRADGGSGMDHRQILFDINVECALPETPVIQVLQSGNTYSFSCNSDTSASLLWDFGNGVTSTSATPLYIDSLTTPHTVKVTFTNWCGSVSDSVLLNASGIGSASGNAASMSIYPNPVSSICTVKLHTPGKDKQYTLELMTLTGSLVFSQQFTPDKNGIYGFDIRHLPNQIYTVVIRGNSGIVFNSSLYKK